jgi:Glycosyl transferase family 2
MRVSIIILSYNYEAFVDVAIRSALEQRGVETEVIVVDDGSTDGSREVISRWGTRVIAVFKANGGQASAYNAGFARATGDVVIFLDSDDSLEPDACATLVAMFEREPEVVKVHFPLRVVDDAGEAIGPIIPAMLAEGRVDGALREKGVLYASSPASGNAYRKRALDRLMPIPEDPTDPQGADFFAIFGVCLLGEVRAVKRRTLGDYRIHAPAHGGQVVFGNGVQRLSEPHASAARYKRLRAWLVERLGPDARLPEEMAPDFSLEKQGYALTLFSGSGYIEGLKHGAPYLSERLWPAIWNRPSSKLERLALAGWALSVLLLPRKLGLPMARFVCNPASRGTSWFTTRALAAISGG